MNDIEKLVYLNMLDTDIDLIKHYFERAKEANPAIYANGKDNICANADKIIFDRIHRDLIEIREALSKS